jgi:hypothetical protein
VPQWEQDKVSFGKDQDQPPNDPDIYMMDETTLAREATIDVLPTKAAKKGVFDILSKD